MWTVDPPSSTVAEVAMACSSRMRDKDLKERVRSAVPRLTQLHLSFREAVEEGDVHVCAPENFQVDELSSAELVALYDRQLAGSGTAARKHYDSLIAGARHHLCSYCQYGHATTLDHYLPKSRIAALAIEPWNLVPACQQCNHQLNAYQANTMETTMFHPYFEGVDGRWLFAELVEGDPATFIFDARPGPQVDSTTSARVEFQFRLLRLGLMYASVSARDIVEARNTLARGRQFGSLSSEDISEILFESSADAFAADPNSRRGAAYEALAQSQWFCDVGHSL